MDGSFVPHPGRNRIKTRNMKKSDILCVCLARTKRERGIIRLERKGERERERNVRGRLTSLKLTTLATQETSNAERLDSASLVDGRVEFIFHALFYEVFF